MIASILCTFTKLICGLNIRWQGCVPDNKQRIYFANHTSHLDFIALWAALPKQVRQKTRPIAAKDYWDRGRIPKYIAHKVINAVLIERKNLTAHGEADNPIAQMLTAIKQGASLIIFPEGSRNTNEEIKPFKSGLYHLVKSRPDLEYIPVYLENLSRILPKGEFLAVPLLGLATFGKPLEIIEGELKTDFLNRAQTAVKELKTI